MLKNLIRNQIENTLLISESGIYALLVYHYCPQYRALREWLTHQVIPTLRDAQHTTTSERPPQLAQLAGHDVEFVALE